MSQIKQLLRVHRQGDSIKSIARTLGISKNTVKSYLIKLATGKLLVAELFPILFAFIIFKIYFLPGSKSKDFFIIEDVFSNIVGFSSNYYF